MMEVLSFRGRAGYHATMLPGARPVRDTRRDRAPHRQPSSESVA